MSDCGALSIVVIAMLGNPFSPDLHLPPLERVSLNVALHARGAKYWSLFERRVDPSALSADRAALGASVIERVGDALVVEVDERTTPGDKRLRGRVILRPEVATPYEYAIDEQGLHKWWPVAPLARISVRFEEPEVSFEGHAYADANAGEVPLETTFARWSWSRARDGDRALIGYDVRLKDGSARACALSIDAGGARAVPGLARVPLGRSWWLLGRELLADPGTRASVVRGLEDGPFYARALVSARIDGSPVVAMHETLDARRLEQPLVKRMLRYKMGRAP